MHRALLITCALVVIASPASAAQSPRETQRGCPVELQAALPELPPSSDNAPDDQLEVLAPRVEVDLNTGANFPDGLELRSANRVLTAPAASYDKLTGDFKVSGDVIYRDRSTIVHGTEAQFNAGNDRLDIRSGQFDLLGIPARGSAGAITVEGTNRLQLSDVTYTTCARGHDEWLLRASSIHIDGDTGVATARNARLEFQGIPIFYTPWISYPVTNNRKSGFLLPNIGRSESRGIEFDLPFYLNLAPNYDATLTPRYMSRRGVELVSEFRYLFPSQQGKLGAEFLPHDNTSGDSRYLLSWADQSLFGDSLRVSVDARDVSDKHYFEDLYSGLASTSQTHLERRLDVEFVNEFWSVLMRLQGYQTLDEILAPADKPYARVPEIVAHGSLPRGPLGLTYTLSSNFDYFERSAGVTGSRLNLMPELSLPLRYRGFYFEPAAALDFTQYWLDNVTAGQPSSPDRIAPIFSADAGTAFERIMTTSGTLLQTIEPRIQYVHIPFRRQDDLPVFDTIEPDFNLVQLFRKNRFVGLDRLGDTDQLSVGITSRIIDATNGSQLLTATVGQTRFLSDHNVTLPGQTASQDAASNYVAELGFHVQNHWNVDLGYQWNTDERASQLAEARLQYRHDSQRALTLAYRYRRDTLDEIDVAGAWPVTERWSVVGRYDYSILDHQPLEQFLGFEYQTCCWGVRMTLRRNLVDRNGNSDTSVGVQLVLKGLGSNTEPADRLLGRGILGYERD